MFSLISICYERYGSQEYEDFESLENLVLKLKNELLKLYGDDRAKLEFKIGKNHIVIKDNDMMEFIITGTSDQSIIKEMIDSNSVISFERVG